MKTTMKYLSVSLILLLGGIMQAQTIPNGDFENWETTPYFAYNPLFWTTDNNGVAAPRVTSDSLAYSNDLAMRVTAMPAELGKHGEASIAIPITGTPPNILTFYAKWEKTVTAYVTVHVVMTTNDNLEVSYTWVPEVNQSDWEFISLAMPEVELENDYITEMEIFVISSVGDFAPGDGWLAVDDMQLSSVASVDNWTEDPIVLYPNPANDQLFLTYESSLANADYRIVDVQGKVVKSGKLGNTLNIANLDRGYYCLQITQGKAALHKQFLVTH